MVKLRPEFDLGVFECFRLAEPPYGDDVFPLSQPVESHGYFLDSGRKIQEPRSMQGTIQSHLSDALRYELSYASLPGNSGAPVMPRDDLSTVLGVTSSKQTDLVQRAFSRST